MRRQVKDSSHLANTPYPASLDKRGGAACSFRTFARLKGDRRGSRAGRAQTNRVADRVVVRLTLGTAQSLNT
jgi:hypothetical protein